MAVQVKKPKVKVAPERRGMKKIWNISDWPVTSVRASTVMVMGVSVPPGGVIEVPEERLKNARKTMKDRDAGLIHIGESLPAEYAKWKKAKRARMPKGATRSHGVHVVPEGTPPLPVEQLVVLVEAVVESTPPPSPPKRKKSGFSMLESKEDDKKE